MSYWQDKRCLITGGSAGLGAELARTLGKRGCRIAINGRNGERLESARAELERLGAEVHAIQGDVAELTVAEQVVAQTTDVLGGLDLVCHAAGRSMRGELLRTSTDEFESLWRLNSLAAFEIARHCSPALVESRGHLVFIGSLACHVAARYLGAYPSSKFPLAAMAQQLRLELGPEGLHTLLVCPGPIARDGGSDRYSAAGQNLPASANKPGGGAKVRALDPAKVCEKILKACERRRPELVLPAKARWLFLLSSLSPSWGDWLLRKMSS